MPHANQIQARNGMPNVELTKQLQPQCPVVVPVTDGGCGVTQTYPNEVCEGTAFVVSVPLNDE